MSVVVVDGKRREGGNPRDVWCWPLVTLCIESPHVSLPDSPRDSPPDSLWLNLPEDQMPSVYWKFRGGFRQSFPAASPAGITAIILSIMSSHLSFITISDPHFLE